MKEDEWMTFDQGGLCPDTISMVRCGSDYLLFLLERLTCGAPLLLEYKRYSGRG